VVQPAAASSEAEDRRGEALGLVCPDSGMPERVELPHDAAPGRPLCAEAAARVLLSARPQSVQYLADQEIKALLTPMAKSPEGKIGLDLLGLLAVARGAPRHPPRPLDPRNRANRGTLIAATRLTPAVELTTSAWLAERVFEPVPLEPVHQLVRAAKRRQMSAVDHVPLDLKASDQRRRMKASGRRRS
jgi:hypothetical protein